MSSCDYRWAFRVNAHRSWRERLAGALRKLAQRIDGRLSLGIYIEATPEIGPDRRIACVMHGLAAMEAALDDEARAAAAEIVMRADYPQLYEHS